MVISENCCNLRVLNIKSLQTIIAMITEDKVTEIFCITDDFCKVFDVVSRSIPHLAMNEAALQIAPITFSCSIALLIIGITFSATGVFQPNRQLIPMLHNHQALCQTNNRVMCGIHQSNLLVLRWVRQPY